MKIFIQYNRDNFYDYLYTDIDIISSIDICNITVARKRKLL